VKPEEFPSVLASFLHDGQSLLAHQIPVMLQKIYSLAKIVSRLKGFRFYGCSLLLTYDGDKETQDAFKASTLEQPSSRKRRGESLERRKHLPKTPGNSNNVSSPISHSKRTSASTGEHAEPPPLRKSHSEDLLVGPIAKRSGNSRPRRRGEVNLRLVDFAHTTTGRDWLPYPDPSFDRYSPAHAVLQLPRVEEVASGKGYIADIDPDTGLIYARFPPHYPDQPDRGFLWGLKSVAESLEKIWNEERVRRMKASSSAPTSSGSQTYGGPSADDKDQLPPLPTYGKEIFAELFGEEGEDTGMISS
jgi:inositol-hexakisphosphate 5-kinase